jgi:LysM repeat protein
MERATSNFSSISPQPQESLPGTINVSPSQHLEQLPIAALLAFIPRLRTTYRLLNEDAREHVATGRYHYRLRLGTGQIFYLSDNLLDLVRLIDGRRSIQALSDALAEQQGRPVHPAEIVYLLRRQLVPGGLVELSLPLALPEPKAQKSPDAPSNALVLHSASTAVEATASGVKKSSITRPLRTTSRPLDPHDDVQWIPPGRRAERLRATRQPSALAQRMRRASYINLVATFLVILAAGAAFAYAHAGFSQASFVPPSLSTIFGAPTATPTLLLHQGKAPFKPLVPFHYTAHNGETLATIAARFGVTVNALVLVNHIKSSTRLRTGLVLIIPTVYHRGDNPARLAYPIFYVVQKGDNLYIIANQFGSSVDILTRFNHLTNPAIIKPGDSLVIPQPVQS